MNFKAILAGVCFAGAIGLYGLALSIQTDPLTLTTNHPFESIKEPETKQFASSIKIDFDADVIDLDDVKIVGQAKSSLYLKNNIKHVAPLPPVAQNQSKQNKCKPAVYILGMGFSDDKFTKERGVWYRDCVGD